ncbi:hypothetical protein [Nannocystis punicea]|uniref:STAS domain-containing protein n=1 Tax=Nannocystis punicea TaxID=2995304 RepID=A0ABY7H5W1_9BACT|nr:hypothetical protein [Nannocystis poenicansa]WAS94487.1 hypothetical protein O0S08_50870 [Nannocystis poenicansa]
MPASIVSTHLARALALLAPAPPPPGVTRYLGLYAPSFHPHTLVTIDCPSGHAGEVRLASFATGLHAPSELPAHWEDRAVVDEARIEALRRLLDPLALADADARVCIDGIALLGAITAVDGTTSSFEARSPRPGDPSHTWFAALHALARELLKQEATQLRLEQLHGYLALGPPLADLGGVPRHLRIFGHLTSDDEPALRDFFAAAPPGAPVLVDLRNFEGMAGALFPVLRSLDRSPRPVAWFAPDGVQQRLLAAAVDPSHLFSGLEAARRYLAGKAAGSAPPAE